MRGGAGEDDVLEAVALVADDDDDGDDDDDDDDNLALSFGEAAAYHASARACSR